MSRAWAKAQSTLAYAYAAGFKSKEKKRKVPLRISGVGEGHQLCNHDGSLPVSIKDEDGELSLGAFEAPLAPGNMPALMGRVSLERQRTILHCITHKVYFLGPGDYQQRLEDALPPGTKTFQGEIAPSGHWMLPCSNFKSERGYDDISGLILQPQLSLPTQAE